jgi:hypothetical protein
LTGLTIAFPNSLQIGDKLIFTAAQSSPQTITLTGTTAASLVADVIAQGKGVSAAKKADNSLVFIRVTASSNPRFQLFPCTFATHTSQSPRVIVPRLEYSLIFNRTRDTGVFDYTYIDPDGSPSDWYRMTSIKASVESIPTLDMQALLTPESLCVVTGRVIDPQNRPVIDADVCIQIMPEGISSDNSGIIGAKFKLQTDLYGRFAIPLIQGQTALFKIKAIGYNQVVFIPLVDYVLFSDLVPVTPQNTPDQDDLDEFDKS